MLRFMFRELSLGTVWNSQEEPLTEGHMRDEVVVVEK